MPPFQKAYKKEIYFSHLIKVKELSIMEILKDLSITSEEKNAILKEHNSIVNDKLAIQKTEMEETITKTEVKTREGIMKRLGSKEYIAKKDFEPMVKELNEFRNQDKKVQVKKLFTELKVKEDNETDVLFRLESNEDYKAISKIDKANTKEVKDLVSAILKENSHYVQSNDMGSINNDAPNIAKNTATETSSKSEARTHREEQEQAMAKYNNHYNK